jgi:DNA-directed RNA polymerase subunit N (RpoN/RPB10)
MSLPVRCFSCNKVIGQYEVPFNDFMEQGETNFTDEEKKDIETYRSVLRKKFLDSRKIERYCCRRMFLGYVNTLEMILPFSKKSSLVENFQSMKIE